MRRRIVTRRPVVLHHGQAALPPLVDMLTILLFFILKSFSMDTPVRPDDPDFRLPVSTAREYVAKTARIDVTPEAVYLDGERMASSTFYLERDDEIVQELYDRLQGAAPRSANVRADGRVPWRLLRKVVYTTQVAHVETLDLVAVSRAGL
ncbi:MAG: biopolymer transporter ExbD [Deltaproteobacteria bacterium]|nr:biopolymer transporter ExbD [Deltaproteobacteria bacterium]